jgi:seryl-tRNA synthetase
MNNNLNPTNGITPVSLTRYDMSGTLTFNASLQDRKDTIDELNAIIKEASKKIFENSQGKCDWTAENDKVHLRIQSEAYRAHEAFVRLRKIIETSFAQKFKIGLREARIDRYMIRIQLDQEAKEPIKIPFAKSVEIRDKECTMIIEDMDERDIRRNYVDRMISLVSEKIAGQHYTGKKDYWDLMWSSGPKQILFNLDPTNEMLKRGWVVQGPTKGRWFLRPQVTRLVRTMEEIALDEIIRPLGFQEVIEPHLESFDTLLKTGHLSGVPGELYYVMEPKTRDPQAWENFVDLVKVTIEVPQDELLKMITPHDAIICYVQCPNIYESLSGRIIANESIPAMLFDRSAVSNRNESGGRHGLERVDEFHRIELVYLGLPDQLVELKEKMLNRYKHVFEDILQLEWRMAWVTPFYMQQAGQTGVEDKDSKVKGTIDFEAYLPYRGQRDASEWLEFQNLTILGDKFTKAFNVKAQKGELWSGCSGIGLERWVLAFLSQKGLDEENWPETFRKRVGILPKPIKTY